MSCFKGRNTKLDGFLSRHSFVPIQKNPCPAVPLSRDKSSSKNPVTNSSVPKLPWMKKCQFFKLFFTLCPVVVPRQSRTWQDRLTESCPSLSRGKISKPCPVPRPVLIFDWLSWPVLSRDKILSFSHCTVPLSRYNEGTSVPSVPKSCTVTSRWKPWFISLPWKLYNPYYILDQMSLHNRWVKTLAGM